MKTERGYSLFQIKSVDDDKRVMTGIATTPATDRVGDIVEPKGAQFELPIPFLWQHDHSKPIGWVTNARVTAKGIEVVIEMAKELEPGILKDRLDEAWQSVKSGLVRGLSIGFRAMESADIAGSWGQRFTKWLWLELSAVTIPANGEASIQTVKSVDQQQRAASGDEPAKLVVRVDKSPGASGNRSKQKPKPQEGNEMNIDEMIKNLEAQKLSKSTRLNDITNKAMDEGRGKDASEKEEFDTLRDEIKAIDGELKDLRDLETMNKATAVPVTGATTTEASTARQGLATIKTTESLEKGIAIARYAMCLVKAKGNHQMAFQLAQKHFPNTESVVMTLKAQAEGADLGSLMRMKATVGAGTTTDATWAGPLVYAQTWAGDFIEYLRPRTLIGQANFRRVPFNVRIGGQTSGGSAGWVGQGKAKPVTKFDFNATTIPFTKIAAISVITQELARFSDPSAEALVRDSLADCVIAVADQDLFDPDKAAVANVSPAGLLNGVNPIVGPASLDPDLVRDALLRLWAPWDASFIGARPAYYTTPAVARALSFSRDALGNPAFPGVTPFGGTLDGIPLRVSQYIANNGGSGGAPFILVDESEVYLADDGNVTLDASEQASLEMSDTPTNASSATVTATQLVSMWQTNSIALRAERFIWWGLRRSGAINWIDGFPTR